MNTYLDPITVDITEASMVNVTTKSGVHNITEIPFDQWRTAPLNMTKRFHDYLRGHCRRYRLEQVEFYGRVITAKEVV